MALSKTKQAHLARLERVIEVNRRSLNGLGYFMDANWAAAARSYLETGDPKYLNLLPAPRHSADAVKEKMRRTKVKTSLI